MSPAAWAAYLTLAGFVGALVILQNRPALSYLTRYRYRGRHWPPPPQASVPAVLADAVTTQVIPHRHAVYTVTADGAHCRCGTWLIRRDGDTYTVLSPAEQRRERQLQDA